ncbi:MAG: hypothetical protein K9W44_02240 [Candidatus Lokiarchaeota archaeon]|nr:hypothetical protein [Candidatus Harpocratesius repetitus]
MELEKKKITHWKIRNEKLSPIEIITIEKEGEEPKFQLKQADVCLNFADFQDYLKYLSYIRSLFPVNNLNEPLDTQISPQLPNLKSKTPSKPSIEETLPLILPDSIEIPEIYIFSPSGLCLYHFEFYGKPDQEIINQNLVSGLFSAINLFVEKMGWKKGLNLIRAENIEVRFHKGKKIIIALLSNTNMKINYLIEPILEDLAVELSVSFEKEFDDEIAATFNNGVSNPNKFSAFSKAVDRIFIKFRKQTFELYQKLILNEAMYFDVPEDLCTGLIHLLSEGRSVVNELNTIMKKYPNIKQAIKKVNYEQRALWDLFKTPIYEIKG